MAQEKYVTEEGMKKLKDELDELKNVKRKEIAERIRIAASLGDLSENFDYQNAKEEQEMIERRIQELEHTIFESTVVSTKTSGDTVRIGARVNLQIEGDDIKYIITGPQEADPFKGKISAESPIGRALLGKKKGEKVVIDTPGGKVEYTILGVE